MCILIFGSRVQAYIIDFASAFTIDADPAPKGDIMSVMILGVSTILGTVIIHCCTCVSVSMQLVSQWKIYGCRAQFNVPPEVSR